MDCIRQPSLCQTVLCTHIFSCHVSWTREQCIFIRYTIIKECCSLHARNNDERKGRYTLQGKKKKRNEKKHKYVIIECINITLK